jgi:hypothetical protein
MAALLRAEGHAVNRQAGSVADAQDRDRRAGAEAQDNGAAVRDIPGSAVRGDDHPNQVWTADIT